MVQIPDSLRRQLDPVVKYHFWILAAVVPLLLLPALFMADGSLAQTIAAQKAKLESGVSSLDAVRNDPRHPNTGWAKALDQQTSTVKKDLFEEWTALWESQQPLRVWPEELLGPDFKAAISALEADGRGDRRLRDVHLERYQNTVADIVRTLPKRMGCEEQMAGLDGQRGPPAGAFPTGEEGAESPDTRSLPVLEWKADDQSRLLGSFTWKNTPSTVQVLLAQEELWVYGLFCDVIREMNKGATAHFDSRITMVEELAVGYPAAEENPGGQGTGRVLVTQAPGSPSPAVDAGLPPPEAGVAPPPGGQPMGRPSNPRFPTYVGAVDVAPPGGEVPGEVGGGKPPGSSADDALRQWIYVDFTGRPLTAAALSTSPDAQFVHLVPFALRILIDQRQIDRLLAELAGNAAPIDVRQVRINAPPQGGADLGSGGPGGGGFGFVEGSGQGRQRPFDVMLELRGTVGLATRPNAALFEKVTGQDAAGAGTGGGT